jgi:invasion protein IalB
MRISVLLSGLALAGLISGAALAQGSPAGAAPQGQPDVKQVGDWAVRCFPIQSASPCDMFQQQDAKDSKQRVLSLSIAFIPHLNQHAIQISVPLGVAVQPGVVIHDGNFSSKVMPYRRCDRAGCYVEMLLDNSVIDQLSHGGDTAMIKVTADDGKQYDLKFSLKGFSAAHDSMADLAKQKAKTPPPAPAASDTPAK